MLEVICKTVNSLRAFTKRSITVLRSMPSSEMEAYAVHEYLVCTILTTIQQKNYKFNLKKNQSLISKILN